MNEAFHFLRPAWLLALPLFWMVVWAHRRSSDRGGAWNRIVDPELLPFVLDHSKRGQIGGGLIIALAGSLAVIALAGPVWERTPIPVFRSESALVIALDLSTSMNAEDVAPSRLALAKFKVADLLDLRKDGQTALIVFAAQSFVVTPLTDDTATLVGHLHGLDSSIMPSQGSEPAAALTQAAALLSQAGVVDGHVLLVSDGAESASLERAHAALQGQNFSLSVLGVGTVAGAPIPDSAGGFAKRPGGEIIMSTLAANDLQQLASSGDGIYLELTSDDADVRHLQNFLEARLDDRAQKLDDLAASQWNEFGPWLLLMLLPLAACGFRRGLIVVLLLTVNPMSSQSVSADWWRSDDQLGAAEFERGDYATAAGRFTIPDWRGAAEYRGGNYERAVEDFANLDDALGHYNRGNALARLGRYDEAIAAYDSALALKPGDEDAEHNKKLLEELLRDDQPPEQGQPDDKQAEQDQEPGTESDGSGDGGDSDSESGAQPPAGDAQAESEGDSGEQSDSDSDNQAASESEEKDEQPKPEAGTADEAQAQQQSVADLSESDAERAQATEQWLRQIPDDPSGLLRRKFQYQYKQLYGKQPYQGNRW